MPEHPHGWLSLLPPVAAIVLAILTRRVVLALLGGIFIGALITTGGNLLDAVVNIVTLHLWETLLDDDRQRVFLFTLLMGAMVGVINRCGGMRGLVVTLTPLARGRRGGQLTTWLLGLVIFFDDYANTILLGNTLRPLCDRLKISREKLAFLVDSTAAPVAGLALVSTWVAVEISFVSAGLAQLPDAAGLQAFDLFVHGIPYRFYVLFMLAFVAMVAASQRDFGPMLRAERDCLGSADDATSARSDHEPPLPSDPTAPDPDTPARSINAVLPIGVTVGTIVWFLYQTGKEACPEANPSLMEIFGAAASTQSLFWGSIAGLTVAVALALAQSLLGLRQIHQAALHGARLVLPALVILWLASSLSILTGNSPPEGHAATPAAAESKPDAFPHRQYRLYTGNYLSSFLRPDARSTLETTTPDAHSNEPASTEIDRQPSLFASLLPTIVFILAAAMAFATGTSWGTMGLLLPMVIPLAFELLATSGHAGGEIPVDPESPILLATIGSVLAGAIFGDHCSPISDTTILSSQASGCDHLAHVKTQLPYALVVGLLAIVCGTLPVGFGAPPWLLLPLGGAAMMVTLAVFGRSAETIPSTAKR